jgi:hypothetical protein
MRTLAGWDCPQNYGSAPYYADRDARGWLLESEPDLLRRDVNFMAIEYKNMIVNWVLVPAECPVC